MNLRHEILAAASIESLRKIVVDFEIDVIDKRKRQSLVDVISKARRCTTQDLLTYLSEVEVKIVCSAMDVDAKGRKTVLIERLLTEKTIRTKLDVRKKSKPIERIISSRKTGQVIMENKSSIQDSLNLYQVKDDTTNLEKYEFEPIKGYPMLNWRGKRPFTSTQYFPAQLKEVHGTELDGWRNKLFWGDNLQVMSHLLKGFRRSIDLIYIDPPFDSKADYKKKVKLRGKEVGNDQNSFEEKQYTDIWSNDEFLQFLYERLVLMKELLSDKGVIFIHLDPTKVHYAKIIADEIFGPENFRNEIIWRSNNSHNSATTQFGPIHQNILFYSKSSDFVLHPERRPFTAGYIRERFKYEDTRGIYQPNYLTGPGLRSGESGAEWNGFNPSSKGRHWAIPNALKKFLPNSGSGLSTLQLLDELKRNDLLVIPKKIGGQPMYKQYLTDGVQYQDLWSFQPNTQGVLYESDESIDEDVKWLDQEEEMTGYPTQKPVGLVSRIIRSCTDQGALVMDCFMGSGTTQEAAMRLGRRFIGADINLGAIQTTTKRLLNLAEQLRQKSIEDDSSVYSGLEIYNVNHYEVFRNPIQAKELLIDMLAIQVLEHNTIYDGEMDGRMVKIMPVNRVATRVDLNELIAGFDYKSWQRRQSENPNRPVEKITLVCMGHEPDLAAQLELAAKPFKVDVEVVDILRDKADLEFKRDSQAKVSIKKGELIVEKFYPMNLLQKLSLQKEAISDWKELVESVLIDWNYDGAVLQPVVVDIPGKNEMVKGIYNVPDDASTIRVKITDLLSESWEGNVSNG